MDEMSMIRRLLAEPPPLPHVVAEGRERVFGPHAHSAHTTHVPRAVRRTVLRSAFVVGLTGAAAAAALVVTTLVPGAGTSDRGGPPSTEGSGGNVLLAAAVSAESVPTSGAYWHVRSMSSTTLPQRFGRSDDRYSLEHLSVTEQWTTHSGQTWLGRREWVRPETQDDEGAWRRDGSPSRWCKGKTDTEPPEPICWRTEPGTAFLTRIGEETFVVTEERELTFEQLQRLPHDPDALRAWMVDAVEDDLDESASAEILDFNVSDALAQPAGGRPGAAGGSRGRLPCPRGHAQRQEHRPHAGRVRPHRCRHRDTSPADDGGIYIIGAGGSVRAEELTRTLVIDPDTSYVLASQVGTGASSDPFADTYFLEVGWTDDEPHEPSLP